MKTIEKAISSRFSTFIEQDKNGYMEGEETAKRYAIIRKCPYISPLQRVHGSGQPNEKVYVRQAPGCIHYVRHMYVCCSRIGVKLAGRGPLHYIVETRVRNLHQVRSGPLPVFLVRSGKASPQNPYSFTCAPYTSSIRPGPCPFQNKRRQGGQASEVSEQGTSSVDGSIWACLTHMPRAC